MQATNTVCYLAANAIILFGHCLWYAPSVLWLGFIRWEVGLAKSSLCADTPEYVTFCCAVASVVHR